MNYLQAEKFILSLQKQKRPEYMQDAKHCDLYLKRLQCFLDLIGNPEKKIPHYIHVTGTSGKGSVCLIISSILKFSGKKTGTLTSPSPDTLQSRMEINGTKISKNDFTKIIVRDIKPALKKYAQVYSTDYPSFYEIITAVALKYFADKKVSYAVLEVGCGGRYDATNIIPQKDLALITNIGLDHTEILGNTKIKIAKEKIGIVKPHSVLFTTEENSQILNMMTKYCHHIKSKINILDTTTAIKKQSTNKNEFYYQKQKYTLPAMGDHQIKNAILAIASAKYLKIPQKYILAGIKNVKLPMRFEIISKKPLIILDSAHNPDKINSTVKTLQTYLLKHNLKSTNLVVAFTVGKDIQKMIVILSILKPTTIAITKYKKNNLRQAENPQIIKKLFAKILPQTTIKTFLNSKQALVWAKKQTPNKNVILITGSNYLAGEIKRAID